MTTEITVGVQIRLAAFHMPNFIRVANGSDAGTVVDVGSLSDEDAGRYWDAMRAVFLEHVAWRRRVLQEK